MNSILKGKKLSHKLSFNMESDMSEVAPIHRLAAKAKIKELEIDEGKLCLYNKNCLSWSLVWHWPSFHEWSVKACVIKSKLVKITVHFPGYTEKHKKEITLLSVSADIVSKYTSYVGVDQERPDKITGEMKKRNVPIAQKVRISVMQCPGFIGIRKHVFNWVNDGLFLERRQPGCTIWFWRCCALRRGQFWCHGRLEIYWR